MDADGLSAHPAAANAETHTTITDIRAVNGSQLIERMAWKRAEKQQGEAEDIASEHAREMAAERVDRQADELLCKANHDYLKKFREPLVQRLVFPQVLRFSTTKDTFSVVAQTAAADQLAAPGEPPALAEKNPELSVRIHQSMINNAASTVLSGMILHEETLQKMFSDLLGYVPERLKPDEDHEPWTIEFARERPIAVSFADNGFTLTLRGRHFFKGDKPVLGMNVTASYKFVKADGVFKAVRQGKLEIVSASGKQLSAQEETISTLLRAAAGQGAATGDGGQGLHAQGQVGRDRTARAGRDRSARRLAGDCLASRSRGKDGHRPDGRRAVADRAHSFLSQAGRTRPRRPWHAIDPNHESFGLAIQQVRVFLDQFDEFRARLHAQFSHHPRPAILDRADAQVQVGRHQAIGLAGDDQGEHLFLGAGERRQLPLHFRPLLPLLPVSHVELDRLLDVIAQLLGAERFFQEFDGPGLHGLDRDAHVGESGDDDRGQSDASRGQFLLKFQAAHARHTNVQH